MIILVGLLLWFLEAVFTLLFYAFMAPFLIGIGLFFLIRSLSKWNS